MKDLRLLILKRLAIGLRRLPDIVPSQNRLAAIGEMDKLIRAGCVVKRETTDPVFHDYIITPEGREALGNELHHDPQSTEK